MELERIKYKDIPVWWNENMELRKAEQLRRQQQNKNNLENGDKSEWGSQLSAMWWYCGVFSSVNIERSSADQAEIIVHERSNGENVVGIHSSSHDF